MTNGSIQQHVGINIEKKIIEVAVVVLRYQDEFLLAKRHLHQHQGGKLEFVGGKIEMGESVVAASIREVNEEIGLRLTEAQIQSLGVIEHCYADKQVRLKVSQAHLTHRQYEQMRTQSHGCEQQQLFWLKHQELLSSDDALPEANLRILQWLSLESGVVISHDLSEFIDERAFVAFYAEQLSQNAMFYLRVKQDQREAKIFGALRALRADIRWIVSYRLYKNLPKEQQASIWAVKLDGQEALHLLDVGGLSSNHGDNSVNYLVSVHDDAQAEMVNQLAKRMVVLAAFVSPVCATKTHPEVTPLGWRNFAQLNDKLNMPAIALGGLTPDDWQTAQRYGAIAVSGIRGFINIAKP